MKEKVLILDFGGQYKQLIARRVRECNVYCEIHPYTGDIEQLEPVYEWLNRETFNNIAPLIQTRIANLKKINYLMKVTPATNELVKELPL